MKVIVPGFLQLLLSRKSVCICPKGINNYSSEINNYTSFTVYQLLYMTLVIDKWMGVVIVRQQRRQDDTILDIHFIVGST